MHQRYPHLVFKKVLKSMFMQKKIIIKFIFAIVIGGFALPVFATDLMDIYKQAVFSDQVFQAAKATRVSVGESLPQSIAPLLPQLNIQGANTTWNYNNNISAPKIPPRFVGDIPQDQTGIIKFNSNSYTLTLSQPLINFSQWMLVSQAKAIVNQANATFGAAAQDLIIRVATAYFNVLLAQDNLQFAQAQTNANAEQLKQARQRYEVGVDAIISVNNAQASYDKAAAQQIAAENALRNAQEALRQLTGQTYANIEGFKIELPLLSPQPFNVEEWVSAGAKQNLTLLAQRFATEAARENIKVNFGGHLPTVSAVGTYGGSNGQQLGTVNGYNGTVALQVSVPIYQGGLVNSQVRQAQADYVTASANRENTYRAVIVTTRQNYNNVLAGISKIKADRQAIVSAQSSLDSTSEQYKVGAATMVDVLISLQNLYSAKQIYASDQYTYLLSTLQLKQAAGTLGPNDLQEINQWLHDTKKSRAQAKPSVKHAKKKSKQNQIH